MPQHGLGQGLDVVGRNVRAAVQQGPGLGAQDQELHGPRPGAPAQLVADEVGHARLADARLPHQRQRVADHVVGDRHFAHDPLQVQDFLGRRAPARRGRLSVVVVRRAISNSSSKFG